MTLRKRPRDPAQLAKLMIDIASGEVEDRAPDIIDPDFTRLTNGFSKKLENHTHLVALFAMY